MQVKDTVRRLLAADRDGLAQEVMSLSVLCAVIVAIFSVPLGH